MLFGTTAALGLAATPICAAYLHGALAVCAVFAAFGLTDVSHDVLFTPTRAAMNDIFDAAASERRCALASGVGKLLGYLCTALLDVTSAFMVVAIMVGAGALAQLSLPNRNGLSVEASVRPQVQLPTGFVTIWSLQFAGWCSLNTFSFYFTSVWAQLSGFESGDPGFTKAAGSASVILLAHAVVFLASGSALAAFTRICGGEKKAMVIALGLMSASLLSFGLLPRLCGAVAVVLILPLAYQVIVNTPFTWLEHQPGFDESERGRLTGLLTASLAAAQVLVAIGSGALVAACGDRLVASFVAAAVLNVVVLLLTGCLQTSSSRIMMGSPFLPEGYMRAPSTE